MDHDYLEVLRFDDMSDEEDVLRSRIDVEENAQRESGVFR
jgi:hypothetical protein